MSRPSVIPPGTWPARMSTDLAAGYCGERSVRAFLSRVGPDKEYPSPDVDRGRRKLWLKTSLDRVLYPDQPDENGTVADVAEDL